MLVHYVDIADLIETAEAWEIAFSQTETPSVLSLTRQNLPTVRTQHKNNNLTAQGAYVLAEAEGKRQAILLATGSEVEIALAASAALAAEGIAVAVVSAPCFELFAEATPEQRAAVLGDAPRIGIEAAIRQGWDLMLRPEDGFVGMTGFGASAPAPELYRHFGITADAVAALARQLV